jgi:hypothetical protein
MTQEARIVVLREEVSQRDVSSLAEARGMKLVDDTTRGYYVLATKVWSASSGTQLVYVEDHTADVRWIQVAGPERTAVATAARDGLAHYDPEQLLGTALTEEAPSACVRLLSRLVPHRPDDCDPRFVAVWARMLAHPTKGVRRAAIRTAYGCRWPELEQLVEARLRADPELTGALQQLLQHLAD